MHRRRSRLFIAAVASGIVSIVATLSAQQFAVSPTNHKTGEKPAQGMKPSTAPAEVIEILTLDIKPGRRDEFHKVYEAQSVPLLKNWNFNLVAYGPSLHDANSYYVIRRFKNLEDREKSEDAFYSSDDWKLGPRDAIMGLVDHFAYAVVSVETWKKISASMNIQQSRPAAHQTRLMETTRRLNEDLCKSVMKIGIVGTGNMGRALGLRERIKS